jgi:hypothetical protein
MAETDAFPYEVKTNSDKSTFNLILLFTKCFGLDGKTCSLAHPHKKKMA